MKQITVTFGEGSVSGECFKCGEPTRGRITFTDAEGLKHGKACCRQCVERGEKEETARQKGEVAVGARVQLEGTVVSHTRGERGGFVTVAVGQSRVTVSDTEAHVVQDSAAAVRGASLEELVAAGLLQSDLAARIEDALELEPFSDDREAYIRCIQRVIDGESVVTIPASHAPEITWGPITVDSALLKGWEWAAKRDGRPILAASLASVSPSRARIAGLGLDLTRPALPSTPLVQAG